LQLPTQLGTAGAVKVRGLHPIAVFDDITDNLIDRESLRNGLNQSLFARTIQTVGTLAEADSKHSKNRKNRNMKLSTQDKVAGAAKNISGTVKELAGKVVDSHRLRDEGKAEKVEGKTQKKVGEIEKVLGS
jgi:uncharacterized protein YjbJ (UPF0337 family)